LLFHFFSKNVKTPGLHDVNSSLRNNYCRVKVVEEDPNLFARGEKIHFLLLSWSTSTMNNNTSPSATAAAALAAASLSSPSSTTDSLLSGIIAQLWPNLSAALSETVKSTVEPSFRDLLPAGPLRTLHFTKLDFGSVPIRIDNVIVHPRDHNESSGGVKFDLDLVWNSDCHVELDADYVASFGVKSIHFQGRMTVLLSPLTNSLPVVSAVQYGFLHPPKLELDFTGLADVADWSMLDDTIRNIIQDTLNSMLVLPNRMITKLDPACSFLDIYQPPLGVVRVTLQEGRGFDGRAAGGGGFWKDQHDVYVKIQLGGSETWRSSTVNNESSPVWNESHDYVLWNHDQILEIHAYDEDTADKDDYLGSASVTVRQILLSTNRTLSVDLHGSKQHQGASVTLHCDLCQLQAKQVEVEKEVQKHEKSSPTNHSIHGLLTILVTKASNINLPKEEARCFVRVKYGKEHEFTTATVVDAAGVDCLNPTFDCAFHVELDESSKQESVQFQLIQVDQERKKNEIVLGEFHISHDELLQSSNMTVSGQRWINTDDGTALEFQVSLQFVQPPSKSLSIESSGSTALPTSSSTASLGTVRLTVARGWGFQEEKRRMRIKKDVPDVYCQLTFGSSPQIWRTPTVRNSTTPSWNVSKDYLLSNHGQIVTLTVFDEDKGRRDKDDELGSARIAIGKLLLASDLEDVELKRVGQPTGLYVALRADMVG
jgi:Ca2+-dependent lipid-binding protein